MPDTSQLYTSIKNLMGVDHVFGYIPPHGKKLLANASYTVPGDLATRILSNRPGGYDRRRFKGLERDLLEGRLAIESTPRPIFFDAAATAAIANPSAAVTLGTAGSGPVSTLATATYFFVYTYVNAYGETSLAPGVRASVAVTNGVTKVTINVPTQAGAVSANVYASSTTGAELFFQNILAANFATAFNAVANFPTQSAVPGSNTATVPAPGRAPGVIVTGGGASGGLLASGAYRLKYTYTNANGETTGSSETVQFTVATGNIPSINLDPAPMGVTGINIYLTAPSGATNTEVLYDSVPVPAGGLASNLAGYLQPGVGGTGPNPETPNSLYLLAKAAPTSAVTVPGANTATVSAPAFTPVVTVLASGVPGSSPPFSNQAPYLAPGMQGDVIYGAPQDGGQLQAGTYLAKITYTNAGGETTASPESGAFTVSAGQVPLIQLVAPGRAPEGGLLPAGVTGVNVYLTVAGGATNTETLYLSAQTAAFALLTAPTGNKPWPTQNTTGGHTIRSMRVNADTLGTVDPSWGAYAGAA